MDTRACCGFCVRILVEFIKKCMIPIVLDYRGIEKNITVPECVKNMINAMHFVCLKDINDKSYTKTLILLQNWEQKFSQ